MKIEIIQECSRKTLFEYESDIIPMIGDWIAGRHFEDGYQRTITHRLIMPDVKTWIIVYVTETYPNLKKELTSTEQDLLTQNHLS